MSAEYFSTAALRRQVESELAKIDPGHGHVKFEVAFPDGKVALMMAARVDQHWIVQGEASFVVPTRDWGATVKILGSW